MISDYSSHNFDNDLLDFFLATEGAYSIVTGPEGQKGHVTTTGPEAELIEKFIGKKKIHVGPKKDNPEAATQKFYIQNGDDVKECYLTVVYPKPAKSELHIYLSKEQGFRPKAEDIWFVFSREDYDALFLGSMSQEEWFGLKTTTHSYQNELKEDEIYQHIINYPVTPKAQKITQALKYPRDPRIALECMGRSEFKCEFNPEHQTFLNKIGRPYMECHHLIPLSKQNLFKASLDVPANIVIVCPNCHRCIHHAEKKSRDLILEKIYGSKIEAMKEAGLEITIQELLSIYDLM